MMQADPIRVVDENMVDVPRDGATMGEIVMRGNNVMMGYFDDTEATDEGLPRRLAALGRPRRAALRRLCGTARPRQGHHDLGRREHLDHRGRAGHRATPRCSRSPSSAFPTRDGASDPRRSSCCKPGAEVRRGRADRLPADAASPASRCRKPSSSSTSCRARPPENHRSSRSARRNGLDMAAESRDEQWARSSRRC